MRKKIAQACMFYIDKWNRDRYHTNYAHLIDGYSFGVQLIRLQFCILRILNKKNRTNNSHISNVLVIAAERLCYFFLFFFPCVTSFSFWINLSFSAILYPLSFIECCGMRNIDSFSLCVSLMVERFIRLRDNEI